MLCLGFSQLPPHPAETCEVFHKSQNRSLRARAPMLWEKKGLGTRWEKQLLGDFECRQLWERCCSISCARGHEGQRVAKS